MSRSVPPTTHQILEINQRGDAGPKPFKPF